MTAGALPPVSVCIPAFDEERGIRGALESVAAQDYEGGVEILVCANGCTDATEEIVRGFAAEHPVRLLTTARQGKPLAWNLLVHEAANDLVAFADADVRLAPGALRALARRLLAEERLVAVGALTVPVTDGCDLLTRWLNPEGWEEGCLVGRLYAFRRDALLDAMRRRGYDDMPLDVIHEDVWLTAVAGCGRWTTESGALVYFRPHHWSEFLAIERRNIRAERQLTGRYAGLLEGPKDEALLLNDSSEKRWARRRGRWRRAGTVGKRLGLLVSSAARRVVHRIARWQVDREAPPTLAQAFERSTTSRSGPPAPTTTYVLPSGGQASGETWTAPRVSAMTLPPVSVCISAYNEAQAIAGTLASVAAQDYDGEVEILVCANGCTDGTEAVVGRFAEEHPVRLVVTQERGKPVAWNHLTDAARHDLLAFADADVRLDPGAVRALVRRLMADSEIVAVGGLTVPDVRGCDPLTRILNPPPLDHGCLVGRLYAFRRPAMRAALAGRGYERMPHDVIHDDAWLTAIVGRGRWATEHGAQVFYRPTHWTELVAIERRCVRGERQLIATYRHLLDAAHDEAFFLNESPERRRARRRERWRRAHGAAARLEIVVNFLAWRVIRRLAAWQVDREPPRTLQEAYERSEFSRSGPEGAVAGSGSPSNEPER